ncbi:MAG TPA: hypothetical protein VGW12_18810 [Pyrinomonadaceae bacterium]|nr:hypothetical protein [Pyrinomonadaceae bacterium]
MTKSVRVRLGGVARRACRLVAFVSACAVLTFASQAQPQTRRIDIPLRSFAPTASGRLTIEPSDRGGRARLTALGLPDPQTLSRDARTYVVWASGDGRFLRLGELERDERGNGGLAFNHPTEFERYTLLVTAETGAEPERPAGAPVLSTRAGEAHPVYAPTNNEGRAPSTVSGAAAESGSRGGTPTVTGRAGTDFYAEVDGALETHGGGRALLLEGDRVAPRARGRARVTAYAGNGYVRVRFRGVPLPSSVGANVYVMWAVVPDGRIVYMGSLPATRIINFADIYVRVAGFDADDFELFVTAETRRPVFTPSDRRALSTRRIRATVK